MLKKSLTLLAIALTIASCSANKKNTESDSVQKEPEKKVVATEDVKMFSVSEAEIAKSESGPHVVYFDTDSAKLDNAATSILSEKVLPEAQNLKTKKVVIEAHCDERGSKAYNQKLSEKRAAAVKKYLVENGVKNAKIRTVGYGKSKPVALGHDEASWSKNRRAITISIKK